MWAALAVPSGLACGLKHSFRPALEAQFRDHYYANMGATLLTVAVVGVALNVYKLALGAVLVRQGPAEYERRRLDLLWDFQFWACPGLDQWTIAIVEPLVEGGACLGVAVCWPYAYGEGRPTRYRQYLLFALLAALLATVLLVLFLIEGPLGKCATGQLSLVLFAYVIPLRPLVKHCVIMGSVVAGCFTFKILLTGIQCDVIADVSMVSATMWLGVGAALLALERVERAHFVAVQQSLASHHALRALVDRMVPSVMARRLVDEWGGHVRIGENYDGVSVLFCELQETGGKALSTLLDLNQLFGLMDSVVDSVPDACKIETVGGQFVVAAGVPSPATEHAQAMAVVAMRLRAALQSATWSTGQRVEMRIGIHSGPIGELPHLIIHRESPRPPSVRPAHDFFARAAVRSTLFSRAMCARAHVRVRGRFHVEFVRVRKMRVNAVPLPARQTCSLRALSAARMFDGSTACLMARARARASLRSPLMLRPLLFLTTHPLSVTRWRRRRRSGGGGRHGDAALQAFRRHDQHGGAHVHAGSVGGGSGVARVCRGAGVASAR